MSLDTVTLQCFLAVADTGSFTKAADKVGRTQSAISQQIAKLEQITEKSLINRGKTFSLTTDGELFLGYARKIFELHREALDRFKEPELAGEIRFGLPEDFATMVLSDVLVDFSRLHPRVTLNVECDLTLNIFTRFTQGKSDLVLLKTHQPETLLKAVNIWSEAVEWIGKPDFFSSMDRNSIIPLVLSPQPCVYRENVIQTLEKAGLRWRLVYSSPSYAGRMAAVKAGLGISAIQRTMIPSYLESIENPILPKLNNIHISLLKKEGANKAIESLEYFLLKRLRH
ncbi:LysR substrate-binding domain-containing protein [Legionella drozanskii]|uniref:LysR family transporter transcriptional regulator n=1 Tax=Legionella drozanskii LLAP-1 TaxID=1212489 RepID=A0A0W0SVR8_9GAMM|nr:LysR substrate-binding domain-containing protein [Legionella drozanskii]KTC87458.1 LysR family transporter transcriptional regulator [Legionella drozanskii LLAP-1]